MRGMPLVSIIVLNRDGRKVIKECLQSLLDQTYPNFEVIVVDNASTDGSLEIIRREFPRVKLISNKRNLGFTRGNNVGIRAARGEILALINNDVVAHKEWLFRLVKGILTDKKVGIVSGPIYFYNSSGVIWSACAYIDLITGLTSQEKNAKHFNLSSDIDYFPMCAIAIKKEVFRRIGFLDERFFSSMQDVDFCLRAKRAGINMELVPDALLWHKASLIEKTRKPLWILYQKLKDEFKFILNEWPRWCLPLTLFIKLIPVPLGYIFLFKYPSRHLSLVWRAFFNAISENKKIKKLDGGLPLHIRFKECLNEGMRLWRTSVKEGN